MEAETMAVDQWSRCWDFHPSNVGLEFCCHPQQSLVMSGTASENCSSAPFYTDSSIHNERTTLKALQMPPVLQLQFTNCRLFSVSATFKHTDPSTVTSVLRHCWLGDRKSIRPVKSWVSVCWWWRFDWSFVCHSIWYQL